MAKKSKAQEKLEREAKSGVKAKAQLKALEKMIADGWRPKD